MSGLIYGYTRSISGIVTDPQAANVVYMIYDAYLSGSSLNGLIDMLHEKGLSTPSGKEHWSTAVLHKMLSDSRYIPLVGFEKYVAAQFELERRSSTDENTGKRKTARYHSKNVLSGLFVCAECGCSYRRVQRASGEMVWRCANRVEHGSRICQSSPTITEKGAIQFVCDILGIQEIDPQEIRCSLESITVNQDGSMTAEHVTFETQMASIQQ